LTKKAQIRLRDTLKALIEKGVASHQLIVKDAGAVSNGSFYRIVSKEGQGITLDKLDQIAEALHREPWQLLHPDPEFTSFSSTALKIARKMDSIRPEMREKLYAVFVQMADFDNVQEQRPEAEAQPEAPANGHAEKKPKTAQKARR